MPLHETIREPIDLRCRSLFEKGPRINHKATKATTSLLTFGAIHSPQLFAKQNNVLFLFGKKTIPFAEEFLMHRLKMFCQIVENLSHSTGVSISIVYHFVVDETRRLCEAFSACKGILEHRRKLSQANMLG